MEPFELFAIRYAQTGPRNASQNVMGGNFHEQHSALAFYVWVARRSDRVFLIDTGMSQETAARRGETLLRVPAHAIKLLGLNAREVEDVILTHLHFDHAGTLQHFPRATFHIQESEVAYATGRCMCTTLLKRGYEVEDILEVVRCVHSGRVRFADHHFEIVPGLSLHRTGGHTGGSQVVRVWTKRGWVVVASDSAHLYESVIANAPFPSVYRVDEMVDGFRTIYHLANGSWAHVVPGHDPMVMDLYPAPTRELEGIVVRLDQAPLHHTWR